MTHSDRNTTRRHLVFIFGALLSSLNAALAETDMQMQEKALKAREQSQGGEMDHSTHLNPNQLPGQFRGVFYGYLPCHEQDCNGIKMTLSLNAKDKYLLVIQPAKPQNRESFEKGKYQWDDAAGVLTLTPNKDAPQRRLAIKGEETLLYLTSDGAHMSGDQDRYLLQRSDKANNRTMHVH
ncbi:copper resistance protein NlpE N-terminal domain-containing protein [Methylolobus aquaticus]|nr:copper resistance protein NlpE [Methylolobus aquaticus]